VRGGRVIPAKRNIPRPAPPRRINGVLSVFRVKRVHGVDDLGEIVFCLRLPGLVLNCAESGEEQTDQNRNDRDDDQQLDESKGVGVFGEGTHGANASRKLTGAHVKSLEKLKGEALKGS